MQVRITIRRGWAGLVPVNKYGSNEAIKTEFGSTIAPCLPLGPTGIVKSLPIPP